MSTDAPPHSARAAIPTPWATVAGFVATRLMANLFLRFPYVFITRIAAGLGVSVETLTWVFGARELGGLAAPLAGRWVDRGHTARVLTFGAAVAGACCAAAAIDVFWLFVVVMVVGGAAKICIDLAQNAWLGHHVPLAGRGRVIGVVETTWAGAFLVGIPLVAALIRWFDWRAAFWATGPLLVIAGVASGRTLPEHAPDVSDQQPTAAPTVARADAPATEVHHTPIGARVKPAVWAFCVLQPMAQMLIFAVNGDWFDTTLGLSTGGIAVAGALLGVAELLGTLLAISATDRFGPLRCGMWGILLTAPPLLAVVLAGEHVVWGIGLMVVMDVGIEFAFVAVLPLVSELDVANRGKAVGQVFVLIMVSRAVSSGVAGMIYGAGGFDASVVAATVACVAAGVALMWARAEGVTR